MKQLILNHKLAIACAVLASIIIAAPQIAFRYEHRNDGVYQGIELLPDSPWSPRVREIQDGHGFGSIYYKDGKSDPYLFQPLGSVTVAYMGKAFSLDINNTFLLARFVLSFIVFLLIYSFVFVLSRDKLAALCSSAIILLADALMSFSNISQFIRGTGPTTFLSIDFPVNPAMIFIPLFGFLISFWIFYTKRDWRLGVLSALLLGLNFYNYFYSWTYLYAFGGMLVLLYLVQKKWSEAVRIGSVFLGALLIAIPYGINLYNASQYPTFAEVSMRMGILLTHEPLWVGSMVIAALIIFWVGFPKENREKYLFCLALLLAPFLTMNQQIITGKEMQAAHYHWYFHKPIAVTFIIVVVFYLLGRLKTGWYKQVLAVLIITASFLAGAFVQYASYSFGTADGGATAIARQQYGPVMQWLNQNASKEEVVLANNPISYLVTVYTPLNVFYHRAGYASLSATRDRLLDSLFTFYRLRGVSSQDAQKIFTAERVYFSANLYGLYYRQLLGSYEAIPDAVIDDIVARYKIALETPTPEWLKQKLSQYEVNYVVWDKKDDPDWQLQKFLFLKEVAVFGSITIYRVLL